MSLKAVWVDIYHLDLYQVGSPGWYAFDEAGGEAVMGPFPTREECEHEAAEAERGAT
jgi:hypothetical protein